MFTKEQKAALVAPLDRSAVKQREQFSYITGWHAIKEANRIFGADAWNSTIVSMLPVVAPSDEPNYTSRQGRKGYLVAYTAVVRIEVYDPEDVAISPQVHEGVGYGEGIDYSNVGQAYESAAKEAETDALKRALIKWGNPFGLALYDSTQAEVTGVKSGDSLIKKK